MKTVICKMFWIGDCLGWLGLDWVESVWIGLDWVRLGLVKLDWVWLSWIGFGLPTAAQESTLYVYAILNAV